jgi:DNA-binding protein HU-beta
VNKAELIDAIAVRLGDNRKTASEAVEAVVDTITRTVARGEKVAITGFGIFEKIERAARVARNPATGAKVRVKKTSVPKFRPGTQLKAVVSGATKLAPLPKAPVKAAPVRAAAKKAAPVKRVATAAAKKAAPVKRATTTAVKKAAPAKAAVKKAAPVKKAVVAKKAAPVKAAPVKRAVAVKKAPAKAPVKAPAKAPAKRVAKKV